MNKEVQNIVREARQKGWLVEFTSKGYSFAPPDAPDDKVYSHQTPSDYRACKNLLADLRRRGWDGERGGPQAEVPDSIKPLIADLQKQLERTEELAIEKEEALGSFREAVKDYRSKLSTANETKEGALVKLEEMRGKARTRQERIEALQADLDAKAMEGEIVKGTVLNTEVKMDIVEAISRAGDLLNDLEDYPTDETGRVNPSDIATVVEAMDDWASPANGEKED